MQPASISYGKETTAVSTNDDDDDEGGGGHEDAVGQERGVDVEELRKMMMVTPDLVGAASMEVQQEVTDTGASTVSGELDSLSEIITGFIKTVVK